MLVIQQKKSIYNSQTMSINTKLEIFRGFWFFSEHIMPKEFEYKSVKRNLSPYFKKHGFDVSELYSKFYSELNGIVSDQYIPSDLYYFYIIPALNRYDFIKAWSDKNFYTKLFLGFNQPKTVLNCINGLYFNNNQQITKEQAISHLQSQHLSVIIKAAVGSANGDNIEKMNFSTMSKAEIDQTLQQFQKNFIVQECVKQCQELADINPSSVNTLRIYTYRTLSGELVVLDNVILRFGGSDSFIDNARGGGAFLGIHLDGSIKEQAFRFYDLNKYNKNSFNITLEYIPAFQSAISMSLTMHHKLPYFDLVGWDITIDQDLNPLLIECNLVPGGELPQYVSGTIFGEYTDEVMTRIKDRTQITKTYLINQFPNEGQFFQFIK